MPERFRGHFTHADSMARAIALAGALAELGVQRVILTRPDAQPQTFEARATDLPGELERALNGASFAPVVLQVPERDTSVLIEPEAWAWETGNAEAAERFHTA